MRVVKSAVRYKTSGKNEHVIVRGTLIVLALVVLVVVALSWTDRTAIIDVDTTLLRPPQFLDVSTTTISPVVVAAATVVVDTDSTNLHHHTSTRSSDDEPLLVGTKPFELPPVVAVKTTNKTPLYIITPTSRPSLLTRSIFHVLPLQECFDLHWVIVHSVHNNANAHLHQSTGPIFRNVVFWITEIFTHHPASSFGNHERNVGMERVVQMANRRNNSNGLVYFLDDDNTLPIELCQDEHIRAILSTNNLYYADQYSCGTMRLDSSNYSTAWQTDPTSFSLSDQMDTGNWLTPVWLLQHVSDDIHWELQDYAADSKFFTQLLHALLALDHGHDDRIVRLESVKFHYNELTHCKLNPPWYHDEAVQSLASYQSLLQEMQTVREALPVEEKMDRAEVTLHDYVHLVHVLRSSLIPARATATYVEIGVWKGATSLFMSRHPQATNVVGIDTFPLPKQREEAEAYRRVLQGNGTIHWIQKDSRNAMQELQARLNGSQIDILLIDGDRSEHGVRSDFERYMPLVSEGGFIVFDDFLESQQAAGVRYAVLRLIQQGRINQNDYNIIGSVENVEGAGPVMMKNDHVYEWQTMASNEFVIQKRVSKR